MSVKEKGKGQSRPSRGEFIDRDWLPDKDTVDHYNQEDFLVRPERVKGPIFLTREALESRRMADTQYDLKPDGKPWPEPYPEESETGLLSPVNG